MRRAAACALAIALAVAACSLAYVQAPPRKLSPVEYPSCSVSVAPIADVLVGLLFGAAATAAVEDDADASEIIPSALLAAAFFGSAVYGIRGAEACRDARTAWDDQYGGDRTADGPVDHAYRGFRIPADAGPDAGPEPDRTLPADAGADAAPPADAGAPYQPALEPAPPAPS